MLKHPNEISRETPAWKKVITIVQHRDMVVLQMKWTPFKSVDGICQMFDGWRLANTFPKMMYYYYDFQNKSSDVSDHAANTGKQYILTKN